jgi:hypothetical protein
MENDEEQDTGTIMTHMLQYEITTNGEDGPALMRLFQNSILNQQIIEQIATIPTMTHQYYPVLVIWRMSPMRRTSAFYTDAGFLFSDEAIIGHANSMLTRIMNTIQEDYPEYDRSDWSLTFVIAKILRTDMLVTSTLRRERRLERRLEQEMEQGQCRRRGLERGLGLELGLGLGRGRIQ